ncbi:hypothetical protein B0H14DRAFT_2656162 [Mycena olivaceomarginata]|nr:hypothetical protein B0H14DRAFT_2656162 [Mycena olivaceomarginata]
MLTTRVHFIDSPHQLSQLPPCVSRIYSAAQSPLSWCACPYVAPHNLPLLQELSELSGSSEKVSRLADVFNLTLDAVSDTRALLRIYGSSGASMPFLLGLIRVLAYTCCKEAAIISGTPFVRPRITTDLAVETQLDGIALLLAGHVIDKVDGVYPNEMALDDTGGSTDGSEDVTMETASESVVSWASASPADSDVTSRSSTADSGSSLDIPLNAHVLPGGGRHFDAFLPFICVADTDNIAELMVSVASQRIVWGISAPVIGFVVSRNGIRAGLVISWADRMTETIHITCPSPYINFDDATSLGVYNITRCAEALHLSQLVLDLASDFSLFSPDQAVRCEARAFDWRVDNKEDLLRSFDHQDRMLHWLRDVQMSSGASTLTPTTPPFPPQLFSMAPKPKDDKDKAAASGSQDTTGTQSKRSVSTRTKSTDNTSTKAKSTEDTSAAISDKSKSTHIPSSRYAGRSAKNDPNAASELGNISTWMFDRCVISFSNVVHGTASGPQAADTAEINKGRERYKVMLEFQWKGAWDKDSFPRVDAALQDKRSELLNQAQEILSKRKVPPLSEIHAVILEKRPTALLWASAGSQTAHSCRPVRVNEAVDRHPWDTMGLVYYVNDKEVISPFVCKPLFVYGDRSDGLQSVRRLEETVWFSKNDLADKTDDDASFDAHIRSQINTNFAVCTQALAQGRLEYMDNAKRRNEITSLLVAANTQSTKDMASYEKALDRPSKLAQKVKQRSRQEPPSGICDAVMFAHIKMSQNVDEMSFIKPHNVEPTISEPEAGTAPPPPPPTQLPLHNPSGSSAAKRGKADSNKKTASSSVLRANEIKRALHNPFDVAVEECDVAVPNDPMLDGSDSENVPLHALPAMPTAIAQLDNYLLLPHTIAEYKKFEVDFARALNQGRMYLISLVSYYAGMGIENRDFFCTVTNGMEGVVLMAWRSSETRRVYLLDRNPYKFTLTRPIEAFHYATVLLRLRDDRDELVQLVEEKLQGTNREALLESMTKWSKKLQAEREHDEALAEAATIKVEAEAETEGKAKVKAKVKAEVKVEAGVR